MDLIIPALVASLALGSLTAPAAPTTSPGQENLIVFEQTAEEKARLEAEAAAKAEAEEKAAQQAALEAMRNGDYQYDIASYTTHYSTSSANANRNYNMQLACNAINGLILMPGEEFSYNDEVGS